jgi:hypothetical protein
VFLLTYDEDRYLALWAAKSFYFYAAVDWPLTWLQGGPISAATEKLLTGHLPGSRLIRTEAADAAIEPQLAGLGLGPLREARRQTVMMRKLIDPLLLADTESILTLDSDVLFFARPAALLELAEQVGPNVFFRDCVSTYSLAQEQLSPLSQLRLVPRLNAGVGLLRKSRCPLDRIQDLAHTPGLYSIPWVAEQTIHALLAAEQGVEFLPEAYIVSQQRGLAAPDGTPVVAKHYPAYPRYWYFREGLRQLARSGFLAAAR